METNVLIPTRKQWESWSLPSKLTAIGTLVGVLSLSIYVLEKTLALSNVIFPSGASGGNVEFSVEFRNNKKNDIKLYRRGDAYFWYPGNGGAHETYTFDVIGTDALGEDTGLFVVPADQKIKAVVRILPATVARNYLEQGHLDLSLFIKGQGFTQFSPSFPFTKDNFDGYYIPVEFEPKS